MVRAQDASLNNKNIDNIEHVFDSTKLFNDFIQSQTCGQTFSTFLELCKAINLQYPPSPSTSLSSAYDQSAFYPQLKKKLSSWKAQSIWAKLDKRFYGKEYFVNPKLHKSGGQRAGADTKVLIIGAGPCGLRTAIEMACLGAKVVVLEKRDNFSRNNVLHLWPFIITDLKALGAKKLYGRFCAGAIDHISIRQLQLILLKITLMLGIEIIFNVSFESLLPPTEEYEDDNELAKGWTAVVDPANHPVSKYEFDVVVGADGKRNTLKGFQRKEFRGKLAIGLTVNFINRNTTAEAKVEEISGVAYIFNQEFFKNLHKETGIDLENIVYYKGETHYFVMTAKKQSLIAKGVLKMDFDETAKLLSYENVDLEAMMSYAKEAANFSTHGQLPALDFAINHFGQPDVALFDFTCMYAAENAAMFQETKGHKLLSCLVGDSLLEPFWPMGTGCARGFLAAFDTTWMTRQWALKRAGIYSTDNSVELEVLAERESIYRLLHQTTPQNTVKNLAGYTIDPTTRYGNLNLKLLTPRQVIPYYRTDRPIDLSSMDKNKIVTDGNKKDANRNPLTRKVSVVRSSKLLSWCRRVTNGYEGVQLADMSSSWRSGLAICAIIHRFRPDLISWDSLDSNNVEMNNQLAFDAAEKHLGISPVLTGKEMAECENVDKLLIVTYISQFYEKFKHEAIAASPPPSKDEKEEKEHKTENGETPKSPSEASSASTLGLFTRLTQHIKKRSYSVQGKQQESLKKKKNGSYKKKEDTMLPGPTLAVVHEHSEHHESGKNPDHSKQETVQINDATVKLRPKKQSPADAPSSNKPNVHQRASDRISALSNQLISQWQQNAPQTSPRAPKHQVDRTEVPFSTVSDKCYFCNRRVYIVERLSAEGHFFHRQCFTCSQCGLTLRRGAYVYVKDTGKFFCDHSCEAESKTCQHPHKTRSVDQGLIEIDGSVGGKSVARRYQTPERIELENIRISMLQDLEELPEETLARHNFSGSVSREQGGQSDGEEYMSDSSDDEIDWEVMIRKASQNGDDKKDDSSSWINSSLEGFDSGCQNATILSWLTNRSLNASNGANMLRNDLESSDEDEDSNMSLADISTGEMESSSSEEEDDFEDVSPPKKDTVQAEKVEKKSDATDSAPQQNSKQETNETDSLPPKRRVARKDSLSSLSTSSQADSTEGFVVLERPASSAPIETDKTSADDQASQRQPRIAVDLLSQQPRDISAKEEKIKHISKLKIQQRNRNSSKNNQSKYDTLDRVQEYLLKTPINEELDGINEKQDDRSSLSTTITLSSSSSDDEHVFDVSDAVTTRVVHDEAKEAEISNTPARAPGALPRPLSSDSAFFEGSRSQTDNTSVWSGLGVEPSTSEGLKAPLDESLISEYKSCQDETPASKTLLGRRLSYDSLERRMKFRLRTKNRWLRDESKAQIPLRRSSSDRGSKTPSRSNTIEEKPATPASNAAANSSANMVIIEMTPSVDKPLTPTAPPVSRNQSEVESDQFYTPLSSATKSPPSWRKQVSFLAEPSKLDESADFVSARSTPTVASAKSELPALPKIPHLEAISPTGTSPNTLKKKNIDQEVQLTELRVRKKIEEIKAQQKDSNVDQHTAEGPLDGSFSGYSPIPSRKKSSLKKRNRKSKSPKADQRSDKSETGDVGTPKGKKQRNLFRFGSRKKKKEKAEEVEKERNMKNRATTLDRKYSSQSDREKAILRGERFRISKQNSLVSQTSRTDSYESQDEDAGQYWAQRRRNHLGGLTPEQIDAKIARRVQLAARRQARMEAQKRLRRAQVIQRQLEEVEVKQKELEVRGVEVEKRFRENLNQNEESYCMQEWGKLVQEKNALLRYEQELMIHQRELQLEDVQSRLQQDLRERMALDDKNKSPEELAQEQKLLQEIIEVVEQRDGLVALLDEQRLKEHDEAVDIESLLLSKLERFPIEPNWSIQPQDSFLSSIS